MTKKNHKHKYEILSGITQYSVKRDIKTHIERCLPPKKKVESHAFQRNRKVYSGDSEIENQIKQMYAKTLNKERKRIKTKQNTNLYNSFSFV